MFEPTHRQIYSGPVIRSMPSCKLKNLGEQMVNGHP